MTIVKTADDANYIDTIRMIDTFVENAGLEFGSDKYYIIKRTKHMLREDTFQTFGNLYATKDNTLHDEKTIAITSRCEEMTSAMMGLEDFLAPLERKVTITEEFTRKV